MANTITVWSQFYITDAGLRLRQQTIATGAELTFCFAKIGQGVPSNPENIPLMTDIVLSAEEVPVIRSESDGATHYVGVRVDNKDFKQPVLMTEIGLFAKIGDDEPILYGYTYATQGYDSIPAGNVSHYIWTIGIDTIISRSQSITFEYDGSKVYATEEEMDVLIKAFDDFKDEIREGLMPSDFPERLDDANKNSEEAVEKADKALITAEEVRKEMEQFNPSGITSQDIIVPTTGWIGSDEIAPMCIDIEVEGILESMIPLITIAPTDDVIAKNCKMSCHAKTGDGYIRIYAETAPSQPVSMTANLLSPSGNTASGEYNLLPATADRLGGVKIGDGVAVKDDGTISVSTEEIAATDEEAETIIEEIFGKQ